MAVSLRRKVGVYVVLHPLLDYFLGALWIYV